ADDCSKGPIIRSSEHRLELRKFRVKGRRNGEDTYILAKLWQLRTVPTKNVTSRKNTVCYGYRRTSQERTVDEISQCHMNPQTMYDADHAHFKTSISSWLAVLRPLGSRQRPIKRLPNVRLHTSRWLSNGQVKPDTDPLPDILHSTKSVCKK